MSTSWWAQEDREGRSIATIGGTNEKGQMTHTDETLGPVESVTSIDDLSWRMRRRLRRKVRRAIHDGARQRHLRHRDIGLKFRARDITNVNVYESTLIGHRPVPLRDVTITLRATVRIAGVVLNATVVTDYTYLGPSGWLGADQGRRREHEVVRLTYGATGASWEYRWGPGEYSSIDYKVKFDEFVTHITGDNLL